MNNDPVPTRDYLTPGTGVFSLAVPRGTQFCAILSGGGGGGAHTAGKAANLGVFTGVLAPGMTITITVGAGGASASAVGEVGQNGTASRIQFGEHVFEAAGGEGSKDGLLTPLVGTLGRGAHGSVRVFPIA